VQKLVATIDTKKSKKVIDIAILCIYNNLISRKEY